MIDEKLELLATVSDNIRIKINDAIRQVERLHDKQELRDKTRGSHAAILLDSKAEKSELIIFSEEERIENADVYNNISNILF